MAKFDFSLTIGEEEEEGLELANVAVRDIVQIVNNLSGAEGLSVVANVTFSLDGVSRKEADDLLESLVRRAEVSGVIASGLLEE